MMSITCKLGGMCYDRVELEGKGKRTTVKTFIDLITCYFRKSTIEFGIKQVDKGQRR